MNVSIKQVYQIIREDLTRYQYITGSNPLGVIAMSLGFQATVVYRIRHAIKKNFPKVTSLSLPIYVIQAIIGRITEIITVSAINPEATIGRSFYLPHSTSTRIGARVVIGNNCHILHEVTIGGDGENSSRHPVIRDRVFIGAGAKIIGDITIGNDAVVGANAVVTKCVPDRAVVVGIPAKVVSYKGSFDIIRYPGYENDPDRLKSLQLRNF